MLIFTHSHLKIGPPSGLLGEFDRSMARRVRLPTTPLVNRPPVDMTSEAMGRIAASALAVCATMSSTIATTGQLR